MRVGGFARLDKPARQAVEHVPVVPARRAPQALLRGLRAPRGLAIAPDGRWLALGAARAGRFGLWLVNIAEGSTDRLAFGKLGDLSFSPDGRHLVALLSREADHAEMYVFDLP